MTDRPALPTSPEIESYLQESKADLLRLQKGDATDRQLAFGYRAELNAYDRGRNHQAAASQSASRETVEKLRARYLDEARAATTAKDDELAVARMNQYDALTDMMDVFGWARSTPTEGA